MTEQHQALIDDLGRKKRGHILHIVRWTDRVHVHRYDIETEKAAQKLDALARRQTTPAPEPLWPDGSPYSEPIQLVFPLMSE
jgi:hypothetical protein